jgi:hypothetical protein
MRRWTPFAWDCRPTRGKSPASRAPTCWSTAAGKHVTVTLWEPREGAETVSEFAPDVQGTLPSVFGIVGTRTHEVYEVAVQA